MDDAAKAAAAIRKAASSTSPADMAKEVQKLMRAVAAMAELNKLSSPGRYSKSRTFVRARENAVHVEAPWAWGAEYGSYTHWSWGRKGLDWTNVWPSRVEVDLYTGWLIGRALTTLRDKMDADIADAGLAGFSAELDKAGIQRVGVSF